MNPVLEVKNISISFGGIRAVAGVSFSIPKGKIIGLIGPNGSGKSTCVNLITGVYPLDTGEIYFDGELIKPNLDVAERARLGMGRTFQTPKPFTNYTVYNNIFTIALQHMSFNEAREKTKEILDLTGLTPLAEFPSVKLPIEKRKWLDMARILANSPKFIMLDEVMAGLNPVEMQESIKLIQKINKELGITILFIEHVMKAVVSLCSQVIVLNEGQLLCEGAPEEVLSRQDVIDIYIGKGGAG